MTTGADPLLRRAWVRPVMGLPVSVHVRGPAAGDPAVAVRVATLFAELEHVDEVFSTYRPGSPVSRLGRGELAPADVDDEVREVIRLCGQATRRTDGYFDARALPDPTGPGLRYDPSGLVKGWAVERAGRHLADLDGHDVCLNAGGDIVLRTAAGHPPWRIGIEDPADPRRVLRVLTRAAGAVATSGSAHRGAHVVDPHTGRPADAVRAVTVVGPSLLWADVYATAAVARGTTALDWLETLAGYQGLVVGRDGRVLTTAGWPGTARPR